MRQFMSLREALAKSGAAFLSGHNGLDVRVVRYLWSNYHEHGETYKIFCPASDGTAAIFHLMGEVEHALGEVSARSELWQPVAHPNKRSNRHV